VFSLSMELPIYRCLVVTDGVISLKFFILLPVYEDAFVPFCGT